VITGQDLERISDSELLETVEQVSVYARVSPEHKLRIVQALQARGEIAAMTAMASTMRRRSRKPILAWQWALPHGCF